MSGEDMSECAMLVLTEVLEASVWSAPSARGSVGSLGQQHATVLEHELLVQVAGSAFDLLTCAEASHDAAPHGTPSRAAGSRAEAPGERVRALSVSRVSQRPAVQVALRMLLFPLLERLGESLAVVASAAELTLCRLCASLSEPGIGSVADLLAANTDFLLDALGSRMRRVTRFPHTAQVLQAVLEFGGARVLPLASDVTDDVMRLVDDVTPRADRPVALTDAASLTAAEAEAADHRRQQYRQYAQLTQPATLRSRQHEPPKAAISAAAVTANARLVSWLRALHSLVLACVDSLGAEGQMPADDDGGDGGGVSDATSRDGESSKDGSGAGGAIQAPPGTQAPSQPTDGGTPSGVGGLTAAVAAAEPPFDAFFAGVLTALTPSSAGDDDDDDGRPIRFEVEKTAEERAAEAEAAMQAEAEMDAEARAEEERATVAATPPRAGQVALTALGRVEVLLLHGPPTATHVLLDLLETLFPVLSPWPRALLPAAYPLWPPLLHLFGSDDSSLAAHAMRVFATATRACGDELSSKVMADAVGKLTGALRHHTSASTQANMESLATMASPKAGEAAIDSLSSQPPRGSPREGPQLADARERDLPVPSGRADTRSRAQEAILAACATLRALCVSPRAIQPHLLLILRAAMPLLSRLQAERVQQEAIALFGSLALVNADMVWLACVHVLPAAERWTGTVPAGCARPIADQLRPMMSSVSAAEAVPNVRRVLESLRRC